MAVRINLRNPSGSVRRLDSLVMWLLGTLGTAGFVLGVLRSRLLAHKAPIAPIQLTWDAIAGTSGLPFELLTFLAGAGLFAGLWLILMAVTLLPTHRPGLQSSLISVTQIIRPYVFCVVVLGTTTLYKQEMTIILEVSCVLFGLVVLWTIAGMLLYLADVQPVDMRSGPPSGRLARRLLSLLVIIGLSSPMAFVAYSLHSTPDGSNGIVDSPTYLLTFDAEVDWCPQEDAVRKARPVFHSSETYGSYKYIACGVLERLATGLADRGIHATFYCTPNVAEDHPKVLRELEGLGHEVGVHLHPHNYLRLRNRANELSRYSFEAVAVAISDAKKDIEDAVGHPVTTFRSGGWSCNPEIETACAMAGFTSISNHRSTYLLPSGMWQIATAQDHDILLSPRLLWRSLKWSHNRSPVPLFSHPMVLYDHVTDRPRQEDLSRFFQELDEFRAKYPEVRFMTTTQAASSLEYNPPACMS